MPRTNRPASQVYRVTKTLGMAVAKRDRFTCVYCGASATDGAALTTDHVRPASWFAVGTSKDIVNAPSNLVCACDRCNTALKSDLDLESFARKLILCGAPIAEVRRMVRRVRAACARSL